MESRIAYTIPEAVAASGLSRTRLYVLMAEGRIRAVKAGGRTLVLAESLRDYVASLPAAYAIAA